MQEFENQAEPRRPVVAERCVRVVVVAVGIGLWLRSERI